MFTEPFLPWCGRENGSLRGNHIPFDVYCSLMVVGWGGPTSKVKGDMPFLPSNECEYRNGRERGRGILDFHLIAVVLALICVLIDIHCRIHWLKSNAQITSCHSNLTVK